MHRHPIKSAAALVASIGVAAFVWILPVLAQSGVPIVTDTTPPPIGPTHVPLSGGGDALWTGGSLNFPADPDGSAGDGNQVYRGVAATLQADRPACDNGTAMLTVSTRIRNDGPNNGADYTGRLQFFQGTTGLNVDYVTTAPPVGHVETLSVTQSISAADLAAGNITIGLWLETFHAGGKSWTADQFNVSFEYDTSGCTPPQTFTCGSDGLLFQNPTSPDPPYEVTGVNLITGVQKPVTTTSGGQVNGVGYNVLDDYVYGIRANNDGSGTWSLVQVGSDGSVMNMGQPIGMSSIVNYASGDVDPNGHYWTLNNIANEWYEVDLVPSSPTYLEVISSGTTNVDLGDWVWIDGALYGQQGAAGSEQLVRFTPATGLQTVGPLPDVSGTIGAAFTDGTYFYGSVNDNGDIFRIDPTTLKTDLISVGDPSVGNDGARCADAPLPIDFGDAPDSFGSTLSNNGPRHGIPDYNATNNTASLMLGSQIDIETDGRPGENADGDDNDDIDDEDAVADPIEFTAGQPTTVPVTATNTTADEATLAAWADLDGSGTFDNDELKTVTIGANSGTAPHDMTFDEPLPACQYVRFRIFPGVVADPSPTGAASAGEVEDHFVTVNPDCSSDDVEVTRSGVAQAWTPDSSVQTSTFPAENALNAPDGEGTQLYSGADSVLTLDLSTVVPEGNNVALYLANHFDPRLQGEVLIESSADGTTFGGGVMHTPTGIIDESYEEFNYVAPAGGARFVRITPQDNGQSGTAVRVDAATYSYKDCECDNAENYVEDSSFEAFPECSLQSGAFGAWSVIEHNVHIWGDNCGQGWTSPDGVNSVDLDGGGAGSGGIEQTITGLTPGNTYNMTFYMAFNPASGAESASMRVQIADFDDTYTSASNATLGGFNQVHVEFTASSTSELLRFESLTGNNDPNLLNGGGTQGFGVVVDDIRVTAKDCLVYDYGDAPDSYNTLTTSNGPGHGLLGYDTTTNNASLTLGSQVNSDADGQPSADAGADSFDDGVANPLYIYAGEDTNVQVVATNNTSEAATLAGWVDLNGNGAFDTGERQTIEVPANSGEQTYPLTFGAATLTDDTFARFRIFPGDVTDPQPVGIVNAGEVEDYAVLAGHVQYNKTVSPLSTTPITTGQTFTYTVTVENIGSAPLTNLTLNDDLTDVLDDASYNGDAVATSGNVSFTSPTLTWEGDLVPGDDATITYSVTVNDPISGDGILINGIVGDGPGSNCTDTPATNPDCLTRAPQPDISSTKEVVSPAGNPQAGDTVTYRFTVVNDGAAAATSVSVSDSLSGVLDDAVYNNDATASSGTATFSATNQQLDWQGDLAANGDAGDTVTVDFTVTLNAADAMGDGVLQNGLISADCPNPPIYDTSDPDYDPSCVTSTPVEAWTTRKTATPTGRISANTDVTYTVEIENTGGADLTGLSFNDTLTAVLDDAAYNNDASATSGTASYTDPTVTWNGDLSVDQTATVTYSVTVNDADSLGDGLLNNAVTDSMNCPDPAVTNVNDPNFNPDCVVHHEIAAWTIVKQSTPGPVEAGDDVTYTITVENTGGTNLTGADAPRFRDDLGDVVDDATYNNNATATIGTPIYAEPVLTWQNDLLVGETSTITYTTTVNDASRDGNGVMTNALLGGECPDPAITDPSDSNFNPDCVTITNVSEWVATKQVTPTTNVKPGNVLTYTVSVENTGGVDLIGADAPEVTDDLTALLDDATYNNDEAATTGTISYGAPNVTWTGDLSIGDSGQFSYSATVNDADALGDGRINNVITGSPNCPDPAITDSSDPSFNPDCVTINLVEAWTATKSNNAAGAVSAGDVVDYTLTLENTGGADLTGISTQDDMSGVLDDATYNNNATASVGSTNFNSPHLTWTGDLTAGTTATVDYSVTINEASADGDGTLQNAIVGSTCPDPAITDSSDPNFNPDCVNILGVSEWIASKTADPEGAIDPNTTVNYTVTVENTGGVNLTGAEAPALDDDFTEVQDDATYNNDASATIGTPTYTDPTLSWSNDLSVGQTSVITYSFTAHDDGDFGDGILANAITGSPNCPDPAITDPDDPNFDPNCAPVRYIKAFDVDKSSNPEDGSEVETGETIDYTVTIHNTGALDLTNFSFDDDLSDVLDDATLTGNPTVTPSSMGTTTQNGDTLTFNGDIPIGETATVTYSATVNEDAPADASIRNVIVGLFSNCITGEEEECITTHTVTEGGFLAETGINSWLYVIFGSLLTAVGVGVIYVKRIKRKGWA